MTIKDSLRKNLPWPIHYVYRKIRALPYDFPRIIKFLFLKPITKITFWQKIFLISNCYRISYFVDCPHMEGEMIEVIYQIFSIPSGKQGVIVEAGSFKGGSTAKISLAAKIAGRKFFVFDSFEGIPAHQEKHGKNIFGGDAYFPKGSYAGSLEEVKKSVEKFGDIKSCEFIKGFFEDTMPSFKKPVAVGYLDVDLASSTKTCLKYLYPLLINGGTLLSQDGHLPWIIDLLSDENFWQKELGTKIPKMQGLGKEKLVVIEK
ncbi:MAG: methyltransferase [Candidatus Staskawiczbacteria bacterium]|nr:methyltransferase [Candidatus Staskawiczbacteria bacterium]